MSSRQEIWNQDDSTGEMPVGRTGEDACAPQKETK